MSNDYRNQSIALDKLTCSRLNARAVGKSKGIEALAAMIAAEGLINPLTVYKVGSGYEVDCGARRLAAIQTLAARGEWEGPVACRVAPAKLSDAERAAVSLSENAGQLPMHPLDRLRAFDKLARRGLTDDDIAVRFGLEPVEVAKVRALSKLILPIRRAYAKGEISDAVALAYTEARDATEQARAFKWASDHWRGVSAAMVRERIRGDRATRAGGREAMTEQSDLFHFVGAEAYEADGGAYAGDLFTPEGERTVEGARVYRLAQAKLDAAAAEVRAEHPDAWIIATVREDDAKRLQAYDFEGDEVPEGVAFGFVIDWCGDGDVTVSGPFVKTAEYDAWEAAQTGEDGDGGEDAPEGEDGDGEGSDGADAPEDDDPEAYIGRAPSQAMLSSAFDALTVALRDTVRGDYGAAFDVALAAMIMGIGHRGDVGRTGVRLSASSPLVASARENAPAQAIIEAVNDDHGGDVWAYVLSLSGPKKREAFAACVAATIVARDPNAYKLGGEPSAGAVAIAKRVGLDMRRHWSQERDEAWIAGMTKADICSLVLGLEGDEHAAEVARPKGELVELAKGRGYLPPFFDAVQAASAPEADAEDAPEADAEDAPEADAEDAPEAEAEDAPEAEAIAAE